MALYAFDGTWNSATLNDDVEQLNETNVANFSEAYAEPKWYVSGPGTRFKEVGRVIGGAFGAGARERIKEAYDQLCRNWESGDTTIDIIGFSRGAALALDFGNKIDDSGIRRPGSKDVVEAKPAIRFLGLWDVVGAFGVPINVGPLDFQEINFGHKLYLPDNVQYCFHAMAMDERRQTFRVTRVLNAYEVWFRGVHSDVGGGNSNVGLSTIALRWMLRKALAAGLPIKATAIPSHEDKINLEAPLRPPRDFIPNEYRGFLNGDLFHYTVAERPNHNNPPADCARETEAMELTGTPIADLPLREAGSGQPRPGAHLEVGQEFPKKVIAKLCWNSTGIKVRKGERYDVITTGQYRDKEHVSSAAGYGSPNWFMRRLEGTKRVGQAPWFCLIACVHPSSGLEFRHSAGGKLTTDFYDELLGRSVKTTDAESQLVSVGEQGSIDVDRDGYLYLFANDAAFAYSNNDGEVNSTIRRTQ